MTVIIPSKNQSNLTECVNSIRQCGETCRIIVVDDGLTHWRPDCSYVAGGKPFVYAKNVNIGIRAAGDDDVIVMGDDTRLLQPLGLTTLARSNYDPIVGQPYGIMAAAVTGACGNPNQIYSASGQIKCETRILCFICVHIPASVIRLVGILDERYLGYGCDDGDYCYRARKARIPLLINDAVAIEHGVLPSEFRGHGPMDFSANARVFEQIHGVPYLRACGL